MSDYKREGESPLDQHLTLVTMQLNHNLFLALLALPSALGYEVSGSITYVDETTTPTLTRSVAAEETVTTTPTTTSIYNDPTSDSESAYTSYQTTVSEGLTSWVTVPCSTTGGSSKEALPFTEEVQQLTTYTTIVDGVTEYVTVPCDTTSSVVAMASAVPLTSVTPSVVSSSQYSAMFTSYTTVINGTTAYVTVPCSSSTTSLPTSEVVVSSIPMTSLNSTSQATSSQTVLPQESSMLSSSTSNGTAPTVQSFDNMAAGTKLSYVIPVAAAIGLLL